LNQLRQQPLNRILLNNLTLTLFILDVDISAHETLSSIYDQQRAVQKIMLEKLSNCFS